MQVDLPKGRYVLVSGPSAVGKSVTVSELLTLFPGATRLVTCTTRKPRAGEVQGVDYHFTTEARFRAAIAAGWFIEYDDHYTAWYGQPRLDLQHLLAHHPFVFGIIDPTGAFTIKEKMPEAVTIFLRPTPADVVRQRLAERRSGDAAGDAARLAAFDGEMAKAAQFDYVVDSPDGDPAAALSAVASVVLKLDRSRLPSGIDAPPVPTGEGSGAWIARMA
jgi:guanylate kinase